MRRPAYDLSAVTWRKSSHSNSDGGACLEVSDDLLTSADWFKSSYSNPDGGACVEIAANVPAVVPVRDSKVLDGPVLIFPAADWSSFVTAVKRGTLPA
ncbi:DUF397 domain-containing protein [Streptomyces sp. NPDC006798]|uniref:DUF397 domain-containing protein n=1 Tax=Streptomyces sp. NPDC006798 TaxID=3155462 RepID=UPI0033BFEC69